MSERRPQGAVSRRAVATLLDAALADLRNEAELAVGDVRRGEAVTIDHVSRLRRTLDAVEYAVEEHFAALAALAAPFSRRSRIPRHSLRSCLADDAEPWEIEMDDGTDYERPRFTQARHNHHSDDYNDVGAAGDAPDAPAAGVDAGCADGRE